MFVLESKISKAVSLQDALSPLSLESNESEAVRLTEKVLVGKLLSARVFKRFTLSDIVRHSWQLKSRVQIEKIKENILKFSVLGLWTAFT
ncbi:hypothetical protein FNV43_RR08476 [Rhamnella rubrinervis]|uniref:Uncharacterized protein n=1 Tax=Rhamnella rubrinervis TaxID=2594499 RepID=A0A8K0MJ44_9ROSA|nr:hypothetical protein FNV43_RR08476 [Rhamnella rubrinervis]